LLIGRLLFVQRIAVPSYGQKLVITKYIDSTHSSTCTKDIAHERLLSSNFGP